MYVFATDVTHKYVYGILFMLLSLVLMPHTYISVMSYFFFVSMIVALCGYLLDSKRVVMLANTAGFLFAGAIGFGLLMYHWEWPFGRE